MATTHSYACKDYPGMEACPGRFVSATEDELWKLIEVHAKFAHGEDPTVWSGEDRTVLKKLIKTSHTMEDHN